MILSWNRGSSKDFCFRKLKKILKKIVVIHMFSELTAATSEEVSAWPCTAR